jgi:hypothetical protein
VSGGVGGGDKPPNLSLGNGEKHVILRTNKNTFFHLEISMPIDSTALFAFSANSWPDNSAW